MYLGGGFTGDRLNKLFKENIGEDEILESLKPILIQYGKEKMMENTLETLLSVKA